MPRSLARLESRARLEGKPVLQATVVSPTNEQLKCRNPLALFRPALDLPPTGNSFQQSGQRAIHSSTPTFMTWLRKYRRRNFHRCGTRQSRSESRPVEGKHITRTSLAHLCAPVSCIKGAVMLVPPTPISSMVWPVLSSAWLKRNLSRLNFRTMWKLCSPRNSS